MPVAASDLICYASANMPDTDAGTPNGGAIDNLRYVDFTQMSTNDTIEAISDGADTRNLTIEGRNAAGSIVSETKALTGATFITFSTLATVERILKAELATGDASRTVTVRRATGDVLIRALGPNKRGFLGLFRKIASDPSVPLAFYTKVFWKNEHASLNLLNAKVKQNADPSAKMTHLLANVVDDTATSTNRLTAPAVGNTQDPDTFDDTDKSVPGTDLAFGVAIGEWVKASLTAGDTPYRSTYTSELAGETT